MIQRSKEIVHDVSDDYKADEHREIPANQGNKFVGQSPLLVDPVPLEPDDSECQNKVDAIENRWGGNKEELEPSVLEVAAEVNVAGVRHVASLRLETRLVQIPFERLPLKNNWSNYEIYAKVIQDDSSCFVECEKRGCMVRGRFETKAFL